MRPARLKPWSMALFAATAVSSTVFAQSDELSVEDLVALSLEQLMAVPVSGVSLYQGRRVDAPASVTVISKDLIQSIRARSLLDLLNVMVPGFDALPYRSEQGILAPQLSSRGIRSSQSQQVLVLLNGFIELNDLTHGAPAIPASFDLRMLERIEISRSPSPTHGGAAITVVNLVTREQFIDGNEAGIDTGVHQHGSLADGPSRLRASGVIGRRLDDWHLGASLSVARDSGQDYSLSMGANESAQQFAANDGTDSSFGLSVSARYKGDRLVFRGLFLRDDASGWVTGLTPNLPDGLSGTKRLAAAAELGFSPFAQLAFRAGGSVSNARIAQDNDGATFATLLREAQASGQILSRHQLELLGTHDLDLGIAYELHALYDHHFEAWTSGGFQRIDTGTLTELGTNVQHVIGGWISDTWAITPQLVASAALRTDLYEGWGDHSELTVSPRAALGYRVSNPLALKLVYASSVRPPTLYERLGLHAFPLLGNPAVRSEHVHSIEVSAAWEDNGTSLRMTPFVEWHLGRLDHVRSGDGPALIAENVGTTRSTGVELEAAHVFAGGSRVFGHTAYVISRDVETRDPTPDWPSLLAGGGLILRAWDFDFTNTFYLRALRARPSALGDLDGSAPMHFRWDTGIGYRVGSVLELSAQVLNVTDEENAILTPHRDLVLPQRGRSFVFALELPLGGTP